MKRGKQFSLVVMCALLLMYALPLWASSKYSKQIEVFGEWIVKQMERDRIPGLSIGFMKDDFVWAEGYGFADLENGLDAKSTSAYRLASNTKSMAAAAILQLCEKGKLDLDAEVQKYVPYFPKKEWPVTVLALLGHLGGISHYRNYDAEGHIKEPKDTREALAIFQDFELVAEPWTRYRYSSYGYNLLGAVVEGAAKQPFGEYMREHIWNPLEMDDTYMDNPTKRIPNRVRGYRLIDGEIKNSEYIDISSRFAGGGTRSTVIDMLSYVKGYWEGKILKPETIDMMWTSMATRAGRYTDYGMGWRVDPVNGRHTVSHSGSQAETRTFLIHFPAERFAIALAYNFEGASRTPYVRRLIELLLDEPMELRPYTKDQIDDILLRGLYEVFNYGISFYEKYQQAVFEDTESAFYYFNQCVNRNSLMNDREGTIQKIREGRHPKANDAFVKVGAMMAAYLAGKDGYESLDAYHRYGAIRFFADYVSAYREDEYHPRVLRFSEELENLLIQWNNDWNAVFDEVVSTFPLKPETDLKKIGSRLDRLFKGKTVYPDVRPYLEEELAYSLVTGNSTKAIEVADVAVKLYPEASSSDAMQGHAHLCSGSMKDALMEFHSALEKNPNEPLVSAGRLRGLAGSLSSHGKTDEAMRVIKAGMELHPRDAGLYTSQAEFLIEGAEEYLRKALQMNPNHDRAYNLLKKIE